MLVEEVDGIGPQAPEGTLDGLLDVFGAAVESLQPARDVEPELAGDDDVVAVGRERLADELLVRVRAVDPISAVSKKVTPCSTAERTRSIIVCRSAAGP